MRCALVDLVVQTLATFLLCMLLEVLQQFDKLKQAWMKISFFTYIFLALCYWRRDFLLFTQHPEIFLFLFLSLILYGKSYWLHLHCKIFDLVGLGSVQLSLFSRINIIHHTSYDLDKAVWSGHSSSLENFLPLLLLIRPLLSPELLVLLQSCYVS